MMFHFIKRNGDHTDGITRSPLLFGFAEHCFFFLSICVFTLLHLSFFRFCLWFSLLWLFSGGLMMNESMPYTQKEGVVFGEE